MVGWRFDMFRNRFQRYACKRYFPKIYKAVVARHFQAMSRLEKRHLPVHARARREMRKRTNAPSIFPEVQEIAATTGAISKGYECDAHQDPLDTLPESIGFYPSKPKRENWTFALPDAKIMIDLSKAPCMIYVDPKKEHATMSCGGSSELHGGIGSALFTKRVMVGERARREFAVLT